MIGKLTTREHEVIRLVSAGASNKQVADRLGVRASTVKSHVSNILWKLEAGSRTEAAIIALRAGLVEVPPPREAHHGQDAPASSSPSPASIDER